MLNWTHGAALRLLGNVREVDLRQVSDVMRQRLIDLAMQEPPLVDIDADRIFLTEAGKSALAE